MFIKLLRMIAVQNQNSTKARICQNSAKGAGNTLWNHYWQAGMDTNTLDMTEACQSLEEPLQIVIRQGQGIATAEDDFGDVRVFFDPRQAFLPLLLAEPIVAIRKMAAKAVAAVDSATARYQQQGPAIVLAQNSRCRGLVGFLKRIICKPGNCVGLGSGGQYLEQERIRRIAALDAGQKRPWHTYRKLAQKRMAWGQGFQIKIQQAAKFQRIGDCAGQQLLPVGSDFNCLVCQDSVPVNVRVAGKFC